MLPYSAITDKHHYEFTLTFGQMQADIIFYFRKKTGIKMTDSGLADVVLGGIPRKGLRSYGHTELWNYDVQLRVYGL
jgi:Family of unknown function (DUF5923)